MNVPQDELNAWADACLRANSRLLDAKHDLGSGRFEAGMESLERGRQTISVLWRRLERAGAESPVPHVARAEPTPLPLLDTPANRRYAWALREAVEALKAVERERGISDGASEVLEDWLAEVEQEIHGPARRDEPPH